MIRTIVVLQIIAISSLVHAQQAQRTRPNVIFILADDLGWAELGSYGNSFNKTKHLDRLATQGLRFTHAYAAAPVCSPYRAALLTGKHPARIGIVDYLRPNSANALSTAHDTLPEVLQRHGYSTGMIGKWHLTGYEYHDAEHEIKSGDHGFAWDFAREIKGVGNGANFWPYMFRTQPIRWVDIPQARLGKSEYLTDRMNIEAVDFIKRNKNKPFFLYLSHYAPHTILNGRPDLVAKYRKKHAPGKSQRDHCYLCQDAGHKGDPLNHWAQDHNPHLAAMLHSIDDGVGKIMKTLDQLGIKENTIVIFTSDNGGETNVTSNAPLRGGKSQLYEGGIRVPLIVRWPGQVPEGKVSSLRTVNTDFFPTILEAANIDMAQIDSVFDGVSTLAHWKNLGTAIKRDALYWHYPLDQPHFLGGRSAGSIIHGNYKFITFLGTDECELYNLAKDPSERTNLAALEPGVADALHTKLKAWQSSVGAKTPSAPMLVETRKLVFADHFSPKQVSSRWWFNKDWAVRDGVLRRLAGSEGGGDEATRIFVKDSAFTDAIIRFDFKLDGAKDLRLVTGSGGAYNAVVHVRNDHFFIQTALDKADKNHPHYPYRHGECAFEFKPGVWYSMTVEFFGDQMIAHVDRHHVAMAKHPIINKERNYLAFQVGPGGASLDNVQWFTVARHRDQAKNLAHVIEVADEHPVKMPAVERMAIEKTNAHARLFQSDDAYRKLAKRVAEIDARNQAAYPNVFRSHKSFSKAIAEMKKALQKDDPKYKQMLVATHRSTRAIEAFLIGQQPEVDDMPRHRRLQAIESLRKRFKNDPRYLALAKAKDAAQRDLEQTYPDLFVTNEEFSSRRKQERAAVAKEPDFKRRMQERADAWNTQQAYMFKHDPKLAAAKQRVDQ